MGQLLRVSWWAAKSAVVLGVLAVMFFYLPEKHVVRVVGTDVKRVDVVSQELVAEVSGPAFPKTRDVRFINAMWPNGSPRVYRNEDTGWGFPWYFKFDSGNVQAEAQGLVSTAADPKWVVVTSYGWRIEIFSMFPNIISFEPSAGADEFPIPWFRYGFFGLVVLVALIVWGLYRRFRKRHVEPIIQKVGDEASEIASEADAAAGRVRDRATGAYDRWQDWLDTWRPKSKRRNRGKRRSL